ncbi:MAG TPA: zinc metalloprotease HtpX [Candidatus Nanoarchaeia archaeon]|nr:zinc metalloprotease HtpX [Candidatus Nanoarchaeia archaeon]
MGLGKLKFSMFVTMILLLGTLTGIFGVLLYFFASDVSLGIGLTIAIFFAVVMTLIQWAIAPWLIKISTNMREISRKDNAELYGTVEELAKKAKIPMPKVYLVYDGTPNAFAFARTPSSGHIAVHSGLLQRLTKDEVKAVLAHEIGHIKHWDSTMITVASMVPLLVYYVIILFAGRRDNDKSAGNFMLVWVAAMFAQFLSSLIVMYLSRTREHYADAFSAVATGKPSLLQSALGKIAYGFPVVNTDVYASKRAFYIADPQMAVSEARARHKGNDHYQIDHAEVKNAIHWEKTNPISRFREFFSTHPLTYKRIDALAELEHDIKAKTIDLDSV